MFDAHNLDHLQKSTLKPLPEGPPSSEAHQAAACRVNCFWNFQIFCGKARLCVIAFLHVCSSEAQFCSSENDAMSLLSLVAADERDGAEPLLGRLASSGVRPQAQRG